MEESYQGGCHCGRVRFEVTGDLDRATVCNCSICSRKGFVHLIVDRDRFRLVSGEAELSSYRFNTGVANHLFCRHCGIHAFYIPRSDPDRVDVNVRCLDGVDLAGREFATFDGRNWEEAMQGHVPWR
ncbi:MAG: GFA family protein [Betaproteobacteria bacterium]|jgi:hypothetical protein